MSSDPNTMGNPWPQLRDYARSHPSGEFALKFDPQAALDLATAASNVIEGINGLEALIDQQVLERPVSDLESGTALGKKFGNKATDLTDVLDGHKKILGDMIETFKSAGRAYGNMDHNNAVALASLGNVNSSPTAARDFGGLDLPVTLPPASSTTPLNPHDYPNLLHNFETSPLATVLAISGPDAAPMYDDGYKKFDPTTIEAEASDSLGWHDLWALGDYIRSSAVVVNLSDQAGLWWYIANQVGTVFSDFLNKVDSVTQDQWTGPGSETAVAAIGAYASSIPDLRTGITTAGDNMFFTAGWLDATQIMMPPTEYPPTTSPTGSSPTTSLTAMEIDDLTYIYRQYYDDSYGTYMSQSAEKFPTLPDGSGSFGPVATDPYASGGGGGAGIPSPTGGGGLPATQAVPEVLAQPVTAQQVLAQQTAAQQAADAAAAAAQGQAGAAALQQAAAQQAAAQQTAAQQAADAAAAQGQAGAAALQQAAAQAAAQQAADAAAAQGQAGAAALQQVGQPGVDQAAQQAADMAAAQGQAGGAALQQLAQQGAVQAAQQQASAAAQQQAVSAAQQQAQQQSEQAMSAGQQAAQQAMQAAQQAAQQQADALKPGGFPDLGAPADPSGLSGLPGLPGMPALGGAGAGLGGALGGAGGALSATPGEGAAARLFPRAALPEPLGGSTAGAPRAGLAPMAGSPGSPGAAGGGAQAQQRKERKRPAYLESAEHLDEGLGEARQVVRPVIEQPQ